MSKENKKISKLNIAIGLGLILFVVILVISIKDNSKKSDSPKTKEAITMQQIIKPMVKKIEEPFLFEDKKTSSKEEKL